MARPEKLRRVGCVAGGRAFKPIGRPVSGLEVEPLRLDELEALRLAAAAKGEGVGGPGGRRRADGSFPADLRPHSHPRPDGGRTGADRGARTGGG